MSEAANRLRDAIVERVTRGPGVAAAASRQAAFDNAGVDPRAARLLDKVVRTPWKVVDSDVAAVKASGLSEDEIFELVVSAALGQASRQRRAAMSCLADARAAEERRSGEGQGDRR
jgi:alkylhydroperoxidase family enzyme